MKKPKRKLTWEEHRRAIRIMDAGIIVFCFLATIGLVFVVKALIELINH